MRALRHVVIVLAVTLVGIAVAGKDQQAPPSQNQPRTDAEAVNLIGQESELACRTQILEVDLAGINARRKALQEQIALMRGEAGARAATGGQVDEFTRDLSRLAVDKAEKDAQLQTVRRQLEDVQKQLAQIAPATPRTDAEATNLGGQKNELMRRTQVLELDLAGLAARHQALQEQITLIQGDAGLRAVAGGQLEEFTREQNRLVVDKAGREAQLQTVRKQLGDVQERLAQAAPTTPHTDAEAVNLGGQRNEVTRRAQVLELDLAGLDARRKALQEQIALIRGDADRRATAGAQLEEFTRERSRLAVDQAGKAAQLRTARRQLEEVQKQLARALASD